MPAPNIIQLRQLLSEKFPGLRTRLDDSAQSRDAWATGLPQVDELFGGLPKRALSEFVAGTRSSGSATFLRALIQRAACEGQIVTVIDGCDSLDVSGFPESILKRLPWVRCRTAAEALKAADLVLRDNNLSFVFLDLASNPAPQLRSVPATTWYRFQRLVEETATLCAVITPWPMVSPAEARFTFETEFNLSAQDLPAQQLLLQLKIGPLHIFETQAAARKSTA